MIIVIARAEVDPAELARLRPALDAMMRSTWEESGCLSYSMAIESEDLGIIAITERWADEAAFQSHFATPHMARFEAVLKDAVRSMDVKVYDVTGERSLKV